MKSWVQTQHKADRSVSNQSPIENLHPSDELTQLKHRAESVQSQLEEINRRIREIEQNPRSLFARIDDTLCTGCGRCASICPRRAITPKNNTMQIDQSKCTGCGICVSECPVGAINLIV
ncbi:4Fe-4S binding protein [bacterium]|nr:4Fe-4S binding protein [bacterium]